MHTAEIIPFPTRAALRAPIRAAHRAAASPAAGLTDADLRDIRAALAALPGIWRMQVEHGGAHVGRIAAILPASGGEREPAFVIGRSGAGVELIAQHQAPTPSFASLDAALAGMKRCLLPAAPAAPSAPGGVPRFWRWRMVRPGWLAP